MWGTILDASLTHDHMVHDLKRLIKFRLFLFNLSELSRVY